MPKPRNGSLLHAFVRSGTNRGKLLFPHCHEDGNFVVSQTRFAKNYTFVSSELELEKWLLKGYKLRMSNLAAGILAPSLIMPQKIFQPVLKF
jgi:hypothetical protein